ncbi:retrovirus-related pol polyprotein from transposon TNT 1-94 [Tanacetum coccineum]
MAKASPTQAWLWHRRLFHLNFDTINLLSKKDVVNGLPKLKYVKDQLCSSCELGKAKRSTSKTKTVPSSKGRLNLLHIDLCGPMQIESINGKIYVLVIVDGYSRYTWTYFLRSKDETPEVLKDFLKMIQRNLQAQVITVRIDKDIEDGENLDKMKEKEDACILVGNSTQSKGYRVYNKMIKLIVKSIHINFDELKEMTMMTLAPQLQKTSDHNRSELGIHDHNNESSCSKLVPNVSPIADTDAPSLQELDILFSPLFKEYFTARDQSVSKSFALSDNSQQQDTQPTVKVQPITKPISLPTTVHVEENNTNQAEDARFEPYEFINPLRTPTKDHPLEQVRGNPTKHVQTRRQLSTDPEMCMFTLTMSTVELKNIKKSMANHAWIEMDVKTDFLNGPLKEEVSLKTKYALEILKKHGMDKCNSLGTLMAIKPKLDADLSRTPINQTRYQGMIGSLMYLTSSRPDIVQAVCYCASYQARPTEKHLKEVKRIFRYLKGTINMGLWYPKDFGFKLTAFSNVDHARCLDTRKSTSGGIQFLGEKLVSWISKKQDCIAMSIVEAEYVALSASCAQSAIAISCSPMQHFRTKHINVRYHFIKEQVECGITELYFVKTEYQLADIFTKALSQERFEYLVRRLDIRCLSLAELEVLANETG